MAKIVFTNGVFNINGVDYSADVQEGTLTVAIADVDVTAMGAGGKQRLAGLQDNKLDVTLFNELGSTEKNLWAIITGGTPVAFFCAGSGSSYSDSNPKYSGTVVCLGFEPVGGKVGDALMTKPSFVVSGTVTRGTA
jgi:hypothetical protein